MNDMDFGPWGQVATCPEMGFRTVGTGRDLSLQGLMVLKTEQNCGDISLQAVCLAMILDFSCEKNGAKMRGQNFPHITGIREFANSRIPVMPVSNHSDQWRN